MEDMLNEYNLYNILTTMKVEEYEAIQDISDVPTTDWTSFPDPDELWNGVPVDVGYEYVSNTFLDGFINYNRNIIGAFLIGRYHIDDEHGKEYLDGCINGAEYHTKIGNFMDDVVILVRLPDDTYGFFHYDYDVSDCSIARIPNDAYTSENDALWSLWKYAFECSLLGSHTAIDSYANAISLISYNGIDDGMTIINDECGVNVTFIPPEAFRGWVSWS